MCTRKSASAMPTRSPPAGRKTRLENPSARCGAEVLTCAHAVPVATQPTTTNSTRNTNPNDRRFIRASPLLFRGRAGEGLAYAARALKTSPLVVMALEIESQGLFAERGVPVLYTGLGKVNAAYRLARALTEHRAKHGSLPQVVNFGTVGSPKLAAGSVVACRRFVQRDMDVTGLGFALGTTPFEDVPPTLEFASLFPELPEGVCGTGDRFETGKPLVDCDVIDMEGYALAKVCHLEGAGVRRGEVRHRWR